MLKIVHEYLDVKPRWSKWQVSLFKIVQFVRRHVHNDSSAASIETLFLGRAAWIQEYAATYSSPTSTNNELSAR